MKILIADDHFIVRAGLKYALSFHSEYRIISEATNGEEVLEKIEETLPDLLILDIKMPIMDGLEVTRIVKKKYPVILIIILSQSKETKTVRETLGAGVNAYILKGSIKDDLLLAVQEARAGRIYVSPELPDSSVILQQYQNDADRRPPWGLKISELNTSEKIQMYIDKLKIYIAEAQAIGPDVSPKDQRVLRELNQLLQGEQIFTNEELNLSKIAQMLDTEPHFLSEVVGKNLEVTFPQLLNLYRTGMAMRLLATDRKKKSIEIAFESGFGTKSQYNLIFKEITALTPLMFRKLFKQLSPPVNESPRRGMRNTK